LSETNAPIDIVVRPPQIFDGEVFDSWPEGCATRAMWFYDHQRRITSGEKPSHVRVQDGLIPVFHFSQTRAITRKKSEFDSAKTEFIRRFWYQCRHDAYLYVSQDQVSFIDVSSQRTKGSAVPWFSEQMVLDHLQSKKVYGCCAQNSAKKVSKTYWLAIDLDLHISSGGNIDLFLRQLKALLDCLWGKLRSQIVVSDTKANGIHLYLFYDEPKSLDRATTLLKDVLAKLHARNPKLANDVAQWNLDLRSSSAGKNWKVRQLDDLEIYPVSNKGFRFIGVSGKVLLADRVIGMTSWGIYTRGKNKGQPREGFDLVGWWKVMNCNERMTVHEVMEYVVARLPDRSEQFEVTSDLDICVSPAIADRSQPAEVIDSQGMRLPNTKLTLKSVTSYKGNTRKMLVDFWLGIQNPPKSLNETVLITARLLKQEGLAQDDATAIINRFVTELPSEARKCSSRFRTENEKTLSRDIIKQINNAFTKPSGPDPEVSRRKLAETILAWKKGGFRLSDKNTWHLTGKVQHELKVEWTESDCEAFRLILMPALKVKDLELAKEVATEIVKLTTVKAEFNQGWGYNFLKTWLPEKFGIPCAKPKKQQDVLEALRRLKLIQEYAKPVPKKRATIWHLGRRALARIDGDVETEFEVNDPSSELSILKSKEGMELLKGCEETLPAVTRNERKRREENKGSI
jgi:hypothetical protein